jgi:hypothetical protein
MLFCEKGCPRFRLGKREWLLVTGLSSLEMEFEWLCDDRPERKSSEGNRECGFELGGPDFGLSAEGLYDDLKSSALLEVETVLSIESREKLRT